jgi:hypothetical protein
MRYREPSRCRSILRTFSGRTTFGLWFVSPRTAAVPSPPSSHSLSPWFSSHGISRTALATMKKWSVTTYHSPKDDANQPIDYETSSRFARFAAVLTYYVANDPEQPIWNPNDFFCKKFCKRDTPYSTTP